MVQFCGATAKVISLPKRLNENMASAGVVSHEARKQQRTQHDSEVKSHVDHVMNISQGFKMSLPIALQVRINLEDDGFYGFLQPFIKAELSCFSFPCYFKSIRKNRKRIMAPQTCIQTTVFKVVGSEKWKNQFRKDAIQGVPQWNAGLKIQTIQGDGLKAKTLKTGPSSRKNDMDIYQQKFMDKTHTEHHMPAEGYHTPTRINTKLLKVGYVSLAFLS